MILWRRLDAAGHDACRLVQSEGGWRLEGAAVFRHDAGAAGLTYSIECSAEWVTVAARVDGFLGARPIEFVITRDGPKWNLNGAPIPEVSDLVDLDLGFTPATNLIPLRRVAIGQGQTADLPAAWFDVEAGALTVLPQTYERRSETELWYSAPSTGYEGLLEVSPVGFVRRYPGLWEEEPAS